MINGRTTSIPRALMICGIALSICGTAAICRANTADTDQAVQAGQNPYAPPAQPPVLIVTGTREHLSVDADHAPVVSTLRAIFDKAGLSFAPDAGVVGVVTLHINSQGVKTIVEAICQDSFLQYHVDEHGIYRFEQNPAAIRTIIENMKTLSADLRDKLQQLGLDVPPAGALQGGNYAAVQSNNDQAHDRAASKAAARPDRGPGGAAGDAGPTGPPGSASTGNRSANGTLQGGAGGFGSGGGGAQVQIGTGYLDAEDITKIFNGGALPGMSNSMAYGKVLRQLNFVAMNTGGKEVPVVQALRSLGNEINVPVLVDPGVPSGPAFGVRGVISPRPLAEALNLLCSNLRLEWRWIGDMVYVTPAAEFQVFINDPNSPRLTVPAYGNSLRQQRGQQNQGGGAAGGKGPN